MTDGTAEEMVESYQRATIVQGNNKVKGEKNTTMQFSADMQILFASSLYPRRRCVLEARTRDDDQEYTTAWTRQVHITSLVGGTTEVQKSNQKWPWATCLIRRLTWLHTRLG